MLHYWLYEAYEEMGEYALSKEHKEKYDEICRDNEPVSVSERGRGVHANS